MPIYVGASSLPITGVQTVIRDNTTDASENTATTNMQVLQTTPFTLDDDELATFTVPGTSSLIAIQQNAVGGQYASALFFGNYSPVGATVKIADPKGLFYNSDEDGYVCVYISGYNNDVIVKNRTGTDGKKFGIQIFAFAGI